jgi:hypothetical protein
LGWMISKWQKKWWATGPPINHFYRLTSALLRGRQRYTGIGEKAQGDCT